MGIILQTASSLHCPGIKAAVWEAEPGREEEKGVWSLEGFVLGVPI